MSESPMPAVMPVFPLPNVVFFPGTVLPLNVFEPRYLQMVEDLRAGDGWLAVGLLKPGYESDYEGSPALHEVAGVGRMVEARPRDDGTVLIRIEGRGRVRLREVDSDRLYRRVAVEALEENPGGLAEPEAEADLVELLRLAEEVRASGGGGETPALPVSVEDRGRLINGLAASVIAEPEEKQLLLEAPDPRRRLALLLGQMRVASNILRSLRAYPRPENPENN